MPKNRIEDEVSEVVVALAARTRPTLPWSRRAEESEGEKQHCAERGVENGKPRGEQDVASLAPKQRLVL